jgi:hypothetical protein
VSDGLSDHSLSRTSLSVFEGDEIASEKPTTSTANYLL